MSNTETKEELFPSIGKVADQADQIEENPTTVDDEEKVVTEIESLCMKCHEQGTTRLLLTSIPFFREIVVMSFRCEFCGTQNNEIQTAGEIQPEGVIHTARILNRSDLDRPIVRSATCEISIPEFELVLPPTSRGQLTTVEGLIRDIVSDLSMDQPLRRIQDPENYDKIQNLVDKLKEILADDEEDEDGDDKERVDSKAAPKASEKDVPMPQFTIKLDDPSGNSFIGAVGGMSDPQLTKESYHRTLEQNVVLGLVNQQENETRDLPRVANPEAISTDDNEVDGDEIYVFRGHCPGCGHSIETKMKKVNIPYFKEIFIMSTNCDRCGYRDNEVKSGSAISEKGKRITVKVEDYDDLSRDILKSETAGLTVPEIDLVLTHGTLGGRFTTLEGILEQVYRELSEKREAFTSGDSSRAEEKDSFAIFLKKLEDVKAVKHPFTIILDDPLANSYVQNPYAPDPDPNMTVEIYERTWEQNEELGLNDIKVEGYEHEAKEKEAIADSAS